MPLVSKSHYRLDIEILRTVLYKTEERVVYHRFRFFILSLLSEFCCWWRIGCWLNIEALSCQNSKSHCGVKTFLRTSYLHDGISYTDKIYSYCIRTQKCWNVPLSSCPVAIVCCSFAGVPGFCPPPAWRGKSWYWWWEGGGCYEASCPHATTQHPDWWQLTSRFTSWDTAASTHGSWWQWLSQWWNYRMKLNAPCMKWQV